MNGVPWQRQLAIMRCLVGIWILRYSAVIYDAVDAYSASLTKSMPTALSTVRESHAGASVEGYALFAGGANGTRSTDIVDSVDAYGASLTRTAAATLSGKRKWIGAASSKAERSSQAEPPPI